MVVTLAPDLTGIKAGLNRYESSQEEAEQEAITNSCKVLWSRLDRFGAKKAFVKVNDENQIIAIIPEVQDPERVRRLLQAKGRLEFWETYENSEVYPRLKQLNDVLLANGDESLIGLLNPFVTADGEAMRGPAVGLVHAADTTRLRAMLTSAEANDILQRDVRFVWSAKPAREDAPYYHLIALKAMRNGRAALGGEVITAAKVEHNKWSPEPVIDLSMNAEGAKCWQYLTRDNVGKSIGIVVDGQLYSYPTVMCEIECGRSQITGNFTEEEAADLANMLSSGVMPCPVRIVEEQIIESQK
jgi:SecD/SecF fusion protein